MKTEIECGPNPIPIQVSCTDCRVQLVRGTVASMSNRILTTTILSPRAIDYVYRTKPQLASLSYEEQLQSILFESLNGYSDAYALNFPRFGYEVQTVLPNVGPLQIQWARENGMRGHARQLALLEDRALGRILGATRLSVLQQIQRRRLIEMIFLEQVRACAPQILWIHLITPLSTAIIRRAKAFARVTVAQLDAPFPAYLDLMDTYDIVFSSYPQFVTCFNESGIRSALMPLAFEPTFMKRCEQKHGPVSGKDYNAVFVGSFSLQHKARMALMTSLAETGMTEFWVSLDNIDGSLVPEPILEATHDPVYGLDMYDVYRRAKIALNVHAEVSGRHASIFRMFEITGAGAMLLTDARPNMSEFFFPGCEAATFENVNDCVDKIMYYLQHDAEREEIANKGQQRTLAEHTFEHRILELLKHIEPLL